MNPLKIAKAVTMALLVAATLLSSSTSAMAQAGNLDTTFGVGGIATTPNTSTGCRFASGCAMAIQGDGKIVVAGGLESAEGFALARYNTDGSLDQSFGSGGIVAVPTNNGGGSFGVAIQKDGKIVTAAPTDLDIFVFRFNPDGTLDDGFGSAGRVSLGTFAVGSSPGGVAVQSDGNILVATDVLVRLLADGQLDSSFGTGGKAPLLSGAQALSLLGNGKMLVMSGSVFQPGGAAQYNGDGSLDLSFGTAGRSPTLGGSSAIATLSNGQFVLVGALTSGPSFGIRPQGFVVVRYNSDGTIDTTFGTRGAAVTTFPSNNFSGASAVAVQSNGNIVAAGFTAVQNAQQASDFALARYTADGQLDTTFGTNGLVITSFNGDSASISALGIQSDGKIVAVGRDAPTSFGSPNPGFTLARYLSE